VSAKVARDRAQRLASETAEELDRVRSERSVGEAPAKLERLLGLEHELTARQADSVARVPDEPPPPPAVGSKQGPAGPGSEALVAALRAELDHRAGAEAELRARLLNAEARLGARQLLDGRTATTLGLLREELDGLRAVLGRERSGRLAAELRARALERELGPLRRQTREAYEAVGELRAVLDELRAAESARAQEQVGVEEAVAAQEQAGVEEAVAAGEQVAVEVEPEPEIEVQAPVESDAPVQPADEAPSVRLSEALERLRDDIAPLDTDQPASDTPDRDTERPATETGPWLRPVFRWLTQHDPDQAGRLLVDLLPAQRAAAPEPVAYDLMLGGDAGCIRVTVDEPGSRVVHDDVPRRSREVDFQVFGDYAALAGMLTATPLKRRFGRGIARVRGKRKRVASLEALIDVRLGLRELYEAGVRMQPRTILTVLARVIEPSWTEGVQFALAYEMPPEPAVYLIVGDGDRPRVSDDAPEGPVATRISGPSGALELLLTGTRGDDTVVIGDDGPLMLLGKWIKLAESGVNVGDGHR
jgi:hypothetical protein